MHKDLMSTEVGSSCVFVSFPGRISLEFWWVICILSSIRHLRNSHSFSFSPFLPPSPHLSLSTLSLSLFPNNFRDSYVFRFFFFSWNIEIWKALLLNSNRKKADNLQSYIFSWTCQKAEVTEQPTLLIFKVNQVHSVRERDVRKSLPGGRLWEEGSANIHQAIFRYSLKDSLKVTSGLATMRTWNWYYWVILFQHNPQITTLSQIIFSSLFSYKRETDHGYGKQTCSCQGDKCEGAGWTENLGFVDANI